MNQRLTLTLVSCLLCACLCLGLVQPARAMEEIPEASGSVLQEETTEAENAQGPSGDVSEAENVQEPTTGIPETESAQVSSEDAPEEENVQAPYAGDDSEEDISQEPSSEEPLQEPFKEDPIQPEESREETPFTPLIFAPEACPLLLAEYTWQPGENIFVLFEEWPWVVALSQDEGRTYERIIPQCLEEGFSFTLPELREDSILAIFPAGDANLDGLVDQADLDAMKECLLTQASPEVWLLPALDLDQNGELTMLDLVRLKAVLLGRQPLDWIPGEII